VSGPLEQLPFTREEVEAIGTSVRPGRKDVLIGSAASEAALKDGLKAGSARIVHLAVHGLVDPAEPTRSCIALSPDASSKEDGYFHTLEILSAPVTARLVVLSACESGTGRLSRGEGVVGLSRSFIGAGAGGVVASLWKVSDESTSVLMKEFYNRMIGEKEPAAVALSGARKAMIANEKYAHPFHWAAFVVIGSDRAPW
jgi:CHAT domain-containing protein